VTNAEAQPGVSVYLTPQNTGALPGPTLELDYPVCGSLRWGNPFCTFAPAVKTGDPDFEGAPGVLAELVAPAARWYIIDFQAAALSTPIKLRHQSGGPIIETWDRAVCDASTCNYLTAEFLQQGQHNFYLYVPGIYGPEWVFWAVSMESYP
jgi:hypothetical protein